MIVHFIHHPVSAKKLVEPIVAALDAQGAEVELWIEDRKGLAEFVGAIDCPKAFAKFDLSLNPFRVLARLGGLVRRFLQVRPEAVHAHQTRAALIPLLAAVVARVPVRIYHNRGTPYLGYRGGLRFLLRSLEFINCQLATHVVTVSHSIRREMIHNRIVPESKCEVLGHGSACGIDLTQFAAETFDREHRIEARRTLGIDQEAYVVLYVGRPFRRKGFHTLLTAWRQMGGDKDGDTLLIAGCTPQDVVRATGSTMKSVKAIGYVKDMRKCYAACDVVVLPSWHEGFPYALLEGAAAARALIGSDIPGIDSIISDRRNGLLVPPRSVEALIEALDTLKRDPALRRQFGTAGRRTVERHFDRRDFNQLLFSYYDRIGLGDWASRASLASGDVTSPAVEAYVCDTASAGSGWPVKEWPGDRRRESLKYGQRTTKEESHAVDA